MRELVCQSCNRRFQEDSCLWKCPCGGYFNLSFKRAKAGNYKGSFPKRRIQGRPPSLWRYREALPFNEGDEIVSLGEGFTPLIPWKTQDYRLYLKLEFLFPTGSFKDRGATVMISRLKALGISHIVEDSSGNAGASIAAYAGRAGIKCDVYVPRAISCDKLTQIRGYGAKVIKVEGSREETAQAAMVATEKSYYASHAWNPYFFQGTKTFAFEVWEQLGFRAPAAIVLPLGHGTLFLGAYYGYRELFEAGEIEGLPRLFGVQMAACGPLHQAFLRGSEEIPEIEPGETIADGIKIARPLRGKEVLKAAKETGGAIIPVSDSEVIRALKELALSGLYVEPTGLVAYAGVAKLRRDGFLNKGETIIVPLTGSGLKAGARLQRIFGKKGSLHVYKQ